MHLVALAVDLKHVSPSVRQIYENDVVREKDLLGQPCDVFEHIKRLRYNYSFFIYRKVLIRKF